MITTMRRQSLSANSTINIRKMEISSSVENLSHKTIKQKFMRWASKWYYADIVDENPDKPDATLLISLLQSIGFQLRQFEKSNNGIIEPYENDNSVKVTIECGSSKMKAVLEMDDVICQCPNPQDANDAEFWSVSGTAPTGSMDCINKFEETGSTLLPKLSKDSYRVIHDVIHGLLNIIRNKVIANRNMDDSVSISTFEKIAKDYYETYKSFDSSEAFSRCYTQPEMPSFAHRHIEANNNSNISHGSDTLSRHFSTIDIRSSSYQDIPKITTTPAESNDRSMPTLLRQQTWDMETKSVESEPRSSPPKISSSPAICTDLCTSLGRVSLQSNEGSLTLVECLKRARFYIERAQNLQASKRSPSGSEGGSILMNTSKNSDSFVKPTTRPRIRTTSQARSTMSSSTKPKSSIGLSQNYGQKLLTRRSISGIGTGLTGRKSTDISKSSTSERTTPTMLTNPLVRRQTVGAPSPGLKLAVSGAQRKIAAAKVGSTLSISSGSSKSSTSAATIHDQTRVFVPAKRRVSPDIKDSPLHTMSSGSIGRNKSSSTTRTPTNIGSATSSTVTPKSTGSSQSRLSGINSGLKRPTTNLPKFTLTKK